jgi:hypothetical protein
MSRKQHSPTPEAKRLAIIISRWGMNSRRVAEALNVSHKTALRHYASELAEGALAAETTRLAAHLDHISKRQPAAAAETSARPVGVGLQPAARPHRKIK